MTSASTVTGQSQSLEEIETIQREYDKDKIESLVAQPSLE